MSKTYCTYVTFYSGNKLPPFYIGSTSVDKIEKGYRGSVKSKRWKQIYEHAFSIEFADIIGLSPGSIRGIITGSSETICNEIQQSFSKYE